MHLALQRGLGGYCMTSIQRTLVMQYAFSVDMRHDSNAMDAHRGDGDNHKLRRLFVPENVPDHAHALLQLLQFVDLRHHPRAQAHRQAKAARARSLRPLCCECLSEAFQRHR